MHLSQCFVDEQSGAGTQGTVKAKVAATPAQNRFVCVHVRCRLCTTSLGVSLHSFVRLLRTTVLALYFIHHQQPDGLEMLFHKDTLRDKSNFIVNF